MKIWNKVNDPATHPVNEERLVPPVTHEDLGGKNALLTAGMRGFRTEIVKAKKKTKSRTRFSRINEAMYQISEGGDAAIRVVDIGESLDRFRTPYDFGDAIAPWMDFLWAENYREVIDEIARRGLWVTNVGGHIPFKTPPFPKESVEYAKEKLGSKFLGIDNGEHDCRFVIGAYALYKKPKSLREAYEHFIDYEYRIHEHIQKYSVTLSNNTFQPYVADIPYTRMIGAQICESKPNIGFWHALLRGAGKQYGLLWWTSPAEWTLWGAKGYSEKEGQMCPTKGTSISLLRRAWYLTYMYGSSVIMGQAAFFDEMKRESLKSDSPVLSPVGEVFMEAKNWMKKHPERGVQYTPVAIIWDFYTGYVTSKHAPLPLFPYKAWGNMKYEPGHYQISEVGNAFFPEMNEAGYWRDEKGMLSATPCGDIFDILMSNTSNYVLNRYNGAIVLGPTKIEGQLLNTLKLYIRQGGSVATTISQLTEESYELFGIKSLTGESKGEYALMGDSHIQEAQFTYTTAELRDDAEVVARDYFGDPLAYKIKTESGGELLVLLSHYGLTDRVCRTPLLSPKEKPLPRPFLLLQHGEMLFSEFAVKWNIIEVEGSHTIQYLTNLTENERECLVTVSNNDIHPFKGSVRLKDKEISDCEIMLGNGRFDGDRVTLEIEANSIAIVKMVSPGPIYSAMDDIPRDENSDVFKLISKPLFEKMDKGIIRKRAGKIGYRKRGIGI